MRNLRILVAIVGTLGVALATPAVAGNDDRKEGKRLFDEETFGGNERTCLTCHGKKTGTVSVEDVLDRLEDHEKGKFDSLFVHDGLDDDGWGTSRIAEHATIRIELTLPDYVTLKDDPARRTIVVNRGIPTTMNTPALDPLLMYDGRAPDLDFQALDAIVGHAQNGFDPTPEEIALIAAFQQTDKRFFSSRALRKFAEGGPAPTLPDGETESEKRGRAMFDDVPFDPANTGKAGACAMCHSGTMLNRTTSRFPFGIPGGGPPGLGFSSNFVSLRNLMENSVYTFEIREPSTGPFANVVTTVMSPDPGVLLTDPVPGPPTGFPPPQGLPRFRRTNLFKIPTLWGVRDTAPYFHDNSAKTLADVAEQYDFFFRNAGPFSHFDEEDLAFSEQDMADMIAFLNLL